MKKLGTKVIATAIVATLFASAFGTWIVVELLRASDDPKPIVDITDLPTDSTFALIAADLRLAKGPCRVVGRYRNDEFYFACSTDLTSTEFRQLLVGDSGAGYSASGAWEIAEFSLEELAENELTEISAELQLDTFAYSPDAILVRGADRDGGFWGMFVLLDERTGSIFGSLRRQHGPLKPRQSQPVSAGRTGTERAP